MRVKCAGCGSFHVVSPTAMVIIIAAFQEGELQQMTGKGVEPLCLGDALTGPAIAKQTRRNTKAVVSIDGTKWQGRNVAA